MYSAIARNKRNTVFVILGFVILISGLGWLADDYLDGQYMIFAATIVGTAVYAVGQYFLAGRQAMYMSGGIRLTCKADNPRLWTTVENLAITTGMPMPAVYVIPNFSPNAFATGRDPKHAMVAATLGLLETLDDDELEGVMAHELGHIQNYDTRLSMIVFGLVVAVGFITDIFWRLAFWRSRSAHPLVILATFAAMILAPIVALLIQMALSRQREFLADATAALTTRHPEALASALRKISRNPAPMQRQNTSMAHLWISEPSKEFGLMRLFSTHPATSARVERLQKIGGEF